MMKKSVPYAVFSFILLFAFPRFVFAADFLATKTAVIHEEDYLGGEFGRLLQGKRVQNLSRLRKCDIQLMALTDV
jgi:hypothetical protein